MTEKMKNLTFLLCLLHTLIFAQTTPSQQNRINSMNAIAQLNTSSQMLYYPPGDVNIKGSRFFYDEFVAGDVWFTDGQHIVSLFLYKFDEVENSVVVKDKKTEKEALLQSLTILSARLIIKGKSVIYLSDETPNMLNKKKLFQLIYNSENYRVIVLPSKKLITSQKIFHDDILSYEYSSSPRYYFKKKSNDYKEINLRKKDLLKVLPERSAILKVLFEKPAYKDGLTAGLLAALLNEMEKNK